MTPLAPVPLPVFRSNAKFDQNLECFGFRYTQLITTKFCTRPDLYIVVTCTKFRCDQPILLWIGHYKGTLNFEFGRNIVNGDWDGRLVYVSALHFGVRHYLNQRWLIVYWTSGNNRQRNLNQNTNICVQEMPLANCRPFSLDLKKQINFWKSSPFTYHLSVCCVVTLSSCGAKMTTLAIIISAYRTPTVLFLSNWDSMLFSWSYIYYGNRTVYAVVVRNICDYILYLSLYITMEIGPF